MKINYVKYVEQKLQVYAYNVSAIFVILASSDLTPIEDSVNYVTNEILDQSGM